MGLDAAALALALDALIGDPDRVWRRVPHPVAWFGALIDRCERRLNRGALRETKGALALAIVLALTVAPAALLQMAISAIPGVWPLLAEAAIASVLLAHRSLHEHVSRVRRATPIARAREALAMIVGRETATLDEAEVSGAAIETLAENLSDGVVAPALFFAVGGLPALVAYKVVNTADSMIGHRTERFEAFGRAAARTDDLFNLAPARLTALLTLIVAGRPGAIGAVRRDAKGHLSPNAGWPEAAFARVLNVRLGGERRYGTRTVAGALMNAGGRATEPADIARALRLSIAVGALQLALYAGAALLMQ